MDTTGDRETPLLCKEEAGVLQILINRPKRMNAISDGLLIELGQQLEALARREDLKVLVISSTDSKSFSAGDDIREFPTFNDTEKERHIERGQQVLMRLSDLPMPVVAAIEGWCLGGGLELALACDMRVAGAHAVFGLPEVAALNSIPAWGAPYRLSRLVGGGRAREMLLFGRRIDAATALSWGLVTQAVAAGGALAAAMEIARSLPAGHGQAVYRAKRMLTAAEAVDREKLAHFDLATFMLLEKMRGEH